MTRRRSRWRAVPAVTLGLVLAAAAACSPGAPAPATSRPGSPRPSAGATTPTGPTGLKPVISGVIDSGYGNTIPPAAYLAAVRGFALQVSWAQLQPRPFGPIAADNPVDRALGAVRRLESASPGTHLQIKLRVLAGVHAPEWAKRLGGAPVPLVDPTGGATGTVGRFWTAAFGRAYQNLEERLAARYDSAPEIREVTVSRCTTFFDEPFIRQLADPTNVAAYRAAGFTVAADQACLTTEIDQMAVWHHTRVDLSVNPYQQLIAAGRGRADEAFTETVMRHCRARLGAQCVLENNSLRYPNVDYAYLPMYAAMRALGPPLAFQTAGPGLLTDLPATLRYAASLGAASVEVNVVSYTRVPAATLQAADASLQARAAQADTVRD